jgi:hypothetical protein
MAMAFVVQSQEFETPMGALASLRLSDYDAVIADFHKKNAERDAAKARVLASVRSLADKIETVFASIA